MPAPIRVLHVDDEPGFADMTATYLERENDHITVETTTSAADGLDHLTDHFDCVISDYDMPGLNGIEFLEAVRQQYPDLPFILYTGKGSEEVASDAISAGVTDYLQKDHSSGQYELLANRLTNAVEQARARTQADKHHRVSTVVREINQALVEATTRDEISHRVCEIITDADPYVFAWIGTVDSETDRVEPQAAAGVNDGYLDDITVTVDESPTGRGPGGIALREDRVAVSQNVQDDEAFAPWREQALKRGYRAVAGIPLSHEDTQYGVLAVYADRSDAFDDAERELLAELGDTIAHAYHRVEIQQEYQNQYRELFEKAPLMFTFTREVNGEPIIEDCNQLFAERLGYSREELRGTPLAEVYTDESAEALLAGGGYDRALTGEFIREQREFVTRDNEVIKTLLRATPRRNTDGDVIGTHALFVDITDQTRLQTLEDLRERMEFALEATDSILFELDLDTGEETQHGPFERLYGVSSDRIETADDFYKQCVHPADRDDLRALGQREAIAKRDGSLRHHFRTHPDSGEPRWIQLEAYAVTDQEGTPQRLIGLDTDITERKEREAQLRQEQERFRILFEQLTQPLVEVEYDGLDPIVTAVNPAFEETFGYDASTIVGESLDEYIVPEDRKDEAEDINQYVREGGRLVSREVTRQTTDGLREFLLENAVYEDESGGFAIYTDITDHKRREEALSALQDATREFMDARDKQAVAEKAAETARTVLDQPINGFWLYDAADDVLQPAAMTAEAVEVIGDPATYTGDESLVWKVFEENELRVYDDVRTELTEPTEETAVRSQIILPLGEHGVMKISATEPATFSAIDMSLVRIFGKTVEAALERADREQQLRSQRATLQRQNDRLNKFTDVVSHDLRTPLQVATGRLRLAREECESSHLADAADALGRMETLIEDLLTIAREGTPVQETEVVGLAETSEDCWSVVKTGCATLRIEADQRIRADPGRLKQLLENLVRNAIEHGGEDVTVTIGDLNDGFYVEDDGPGIPADEREEVFDAGYSTTETGTGFGLNIVHEIVKAHGWEISATERVEGGGARFEITGVEIVD